MSKNFKNKFNFLIQNSNFHKIPCTWFDKLKIIITLPYNGFSKNIMRYLNIIFQRLSFLPYLFNVDKISIMCNKHYTLHEL